MQYDPLKDKIARLIRIFPQARSCLYRVLDLILLRQRYVKRCLAKYLRREDNFRYYDAGAGFCQYSWHVLKKYPGSRVFSIDLKKEYLQDFAAFAETQFPSRFSWQAADLQTFVPQNDYGVVTAIDILEHIEDDIAVLQNFHLSLAEDGILIISTPSDTDEAARFTSEHVRPGYDKGELEDILRSCGFDILESLYSYGTWGSLAWRLIIKTPLSLLAKNKLMALILPIYYLLLYPIVELMMRLDMRLKNKTGTGIIIVAQKRDS
ncbi:MAG: class I SAM-dependent methyltransferase [Candidatus Syntrophosphaera sp.]